MLDTNNEILQSPSLLGFGPVKEKIWAWLICSIWLDMARKDCITAIINSKVKAETPPQKKKPREARGNTGGSRNNL